MNQIRIIPEQVVAAYRETGLKPRQGNYFWNNGEQPCACGLDAVYKHDTEMESEPTTYFNKILGVDYRIGFVQGFDNLPQQWINRGESFRTGYEDGQRAWQAVVDAGLI